LFLRFKFPDSAFKVFEGHVSNISSGIGADKAGFYIFFYALLGVETNRQVVNFFREWASLEKTSPDILLQRPVRGYGGKRPMKNG
jgi:hypothetical protein